MCIGIHPNPCEALCDADQALTPAEFATFLEKLGAVARAIGRDI
jgi:3-deoxy-7-phosphoheptulonate synthase